MLYLGCICWMTKALQAVNKASFWEVQIVVLVLMLLFSFAHSETPVSRELSLAPARST